MCRYLLILLFCNTGFFAFPQRVHLKFEHIQTDDGLSQSNVLCILQDSRGFMWFGTRDGLNKYDGYKFTVYKNDPSDSTSLGNNFIRKITEDKNGDLWMATSGSGLCRYNRRTDRFTTFKNDPKNRMSISSDFTTSLLQDSTGIWIGTEAGLNFFDVKKNRFVRYTNDIHDQNSLSDNYVREIFRDSWNNLWIGTFNGLNLFNLTSRTFVRFLHDAKNSGSISHNNVSAIFEDSRRRLWVGTDGGGLNVLDRKKGVFYHYTKGDGKNNLRSNTIYAINEDDKRHLWIGTENGGLSIFNPASGSIDTYQYDEVDNTSISNNSIYSIYKDAKHNMWLGTHAAGINLVSRDAAKFNHYKHKSAENSLGNNNVLCIYEDSKKNIWVGTDGGGADLFDPVTGSFTHFRHKKDDKNSICGDYVLSICEDAGGNIWFGTWGDGITVFNKTKNTFKHFKNDPADTFSLSNNNAWKIFKDQDNHIWIGTYGGGLNVFNPRTNSFTSYRHDKNNPDGISGNNVYSIYQDKAGRMWFSIAGAGLNLLDKKTKTFSHFLHSENKNSIANNSVSNVFEDRNGNLWIGTTAGLSFRDKNTSRFITFTTKNGLPNNVIFGILEDKRGNLWISTNKGISRFDPITKTFKNFDVSDGLQSNEFKIHAFCKSAAGTMYFGGNNGFNQFNPENIRLIDFDPPLVITSFRIFNKEVPIATGKNDPSPLKQYITETKAITLPYNKADFSFEFASLNYTIPEKKQYAYKLEGFDNAWNEAGTNRTATYTNLDAGGYIFKVRGLNNNGGWSSKITSLKITITPPFWLTWWFKVLIVLIVAGSGFAFYFFRVKIIQVQKRALERRVRMQTAQLLHLNDEEHRARLEAEKAHAESDKARRQADRINKELERKNKELEQFAYVASHDLQEPLRTSSSYVKLLQKHYQGKLDERAEKYFNYIVDSSERMRILIKDLLDFSRIGVKGEFEKVDCNKILRDVIADIEIAINDCSAQITSENLPVINGYATELKQLFQNLIINAVKFRNRDMCPKIHISVEKVDDYWQFAFSDNGIGIDKQHNERIFIIFQRLHNRTEYKGSGIGLSHCKKIVELHHGKIWVKSKPGDGSTFYFTLPAQHVSNKDNIPEEKDQHEIHPI